MINLQQMMLLFNWLNFELYDVRKWFLFDNKLYVNDDSYTDF